MASSSGPPTAPAASVWVVVHVPGSEPEDAFRITPVPLDVSALKDVVKVKMTPTLEHCASPQLRVWQCTSEPSQRPPNESPLKPSALLVRGAFYWVEAPAKPPAQGCWHRLSLSLSLSFSFSLSLSFSVYICPGCPVTYNSPGAKKLCWASVPFSYRFGNGDWGWGCTPPHREFACL